MPDNSVALALAAGGFRGAYQAGALVYFEERGVKFSAVSGTSIGSLNAAFYAQYHGEPGVASRLVALWRSLPEAGLIRLGPGAIAMAARVVSRFAPAIGTALLTIAGQGGSVLDPGPVEAFLDRWLDYARICRSSIPLTVAALRELDPLVDIATGTWRKATYFKASELGPTELRNALLAATAIPLAFPSRNVGTSAYSDAGLADPLPARVLYDDGARRIVSIFLSDDTPQNRCDFPGGVVMQIRPSVTIDSGLPSTFDSSVDTIEFLLEVGYRDARNAYEEAEELVSHLLEQRAAGKKLTVAAEALPKRDSAAFRKRLRIE